MLSASNLLCEYENNPLGLCCKRPRFSWTLKSDLTNIIQTGLRIQVAIDERFEQIYWDSGKRSSEDSVYTQYDGPKLIGKCKYYWRVRVTDSTGDASGWSKTAWFEMAPDKTDLQAKWIAPYDSTVDARVKLLRKSFLITEPLKHARLYASSLGTYFAQINGHRVGERLYAPGWTSYESRLLYQTYDITDLLIEGENTLTIWLANGWYKGELAFRNEPCQYGNQRAFWGQIYVVCEQENEKVIYSDDSWQWAQSPLLFAEWYHGEIYDARLRHPNDWHPVTVLSRGISELVPDDGVAVRCQETFTTDSIITTPAGEQILDFGQNIAGFVRFSVCGREGDRVVLHHAEALDAQGNFYTDNLREARQRVEYICHGREEESFEPLFTTQGFRYVRIDEYPGEPDPSSFTAVSVYSDMQPIGDFSCSHELINRLQRNIVWGMRGNFIDIPTDCPQRDERLGWTGDAQVFCNTACFLYDTRAFFRKWLRDLASDQRYDGGIPYVSPDILQNQTDKFQLGAHSSSAWGDAATIIPWTLFLNYGDLTLLREQYPMMKAWVEYIRARANGNLWDSGEHYGDWVALDAEEGSYTGATPKTLIATAFYAHSTQLLSHAAKVLGLTSDAKEYSDLYDAIKDAYLRVHFTQDGVLTVCTQTAHALSLAFGLVPKNCDRKTANALAELISEAGGHMTTGFVGTSYLLHALSQNGELSSAYKLLVREEYPSWLYQVLQGATTMWEHIDGIKPDGTMWSPDMNSFNHYAYGSIGSFLYGEVAGVKIDTNRPGYKHVYITPCPQGGFSYAQASLQTPYGELRVKWEAANGKLSLNVFVPHNTTATIRWPDGTTKDVGSGPLSITYPWRTDE